MSYGYVATIGTQPGSRDEVVALLLRGESALAALGCHQYLVGTNNEHPDLVYVTELWDSREAHDASLRLPEVQAAIAEARPMLTGGFGTHEFTVAGGLGAPS